jgi:hypothetical protein
MELWSSGKTKKSKKRRRKHFRLVACLTSFFLSFFFIPSHLGKQVYDVRMQREMASFRGHNRDVTTASWHPTHEELFVSGERLFINKCCAVSCRAALRCAALRCAVLCCAVLCYAVLCCAVLR